MLLAQVIPVLALALGFELRSHAGRLRVERKDEGRENFDVMATYAGVVVSVILTVGEQIAIAAAAGNPGWSPWRLGDQMIPESRLVSFAMQTCIYAVFLLPAVQAMTALRPRWLRWVGRLDSVFVLLVLVLASLLISLLRY